MYLDTSDYSRFGDVIRGKGSADTERLFRELINLKSTGKVRFAYSMTVVSELFQFDPDFPATTESKAQALETLCGQVTFYWPMRSLAFDIVQKCIAPHGPPPDLIYPISLRSHWHPNISEDLGDLKETLESQLADQLATHSFKNRKDRRAAETKIRRFRLKEITPSIIDTVCEKYQLDRREVSKAIIPTLDGKISSLEGARRMFSAIARPTAFVKSYFSPDNEDQSLPRWISDVGNIIHESLIKLKKDLDHFDKAEILRESPNLIALNASAATKMLFELSAKECEEFGISESEAISRFPDINSIISVPSFWLFNAAYKIILEQTVGLHGEGYRPERSAAGDLFHLIYLPHCDLWRGDRRFSNIVSRISQSSRTTLVNKIYELPDRIADLLKSEPDECD